MSLLYVLHIQTLLYGVRSSSFSLLVDNKEPGADPEDYTVDHSAIGYLMGPDGAFRQHFSHDTDAETMAKRIKEIVAP